MNRDEPRNKKLSLMSKWRQNSVEENSVTEGKKFFECLRHITEDFWKQVRQSENAEFGFEVEESWWLWKKNQGALFTL